MLKDQNTHILEDIEFRVIYSGRRTLGISVLPDSSVIVRAPYLTSFKTISRVIRQKARWIITHRDNYRKKEKSNLNGLFITGETHFFRGNEAVLKIEKSGKPYIRFFDSTIALGMGKTDDIKAI